MKTTIIERLTLFGVLTLGAAGLFLPTASQGKPEAAAKKSHATAKLKTGKAQAAPVAMYECPMCHQRVTAAQAQKQHMLCSCCKVNLVPVKTANANIRK